MDKRRQPWKQILATQASKCSRSRDKESGAHRKGHFELGLKEEAEILHAGEGQVRYLQGKREMGRRHMYITGTEMAQGGPGDLYFCPVIESLDQMEDALASLHHARPSISSASI